MTERPDMSKIIDKEYLQKTATFKRLQRKNKVFMDMEIDDIQGIIEELLLDLISDEHITSMSTVIPLVDKEHPPRVIIGLFTDENNLNRTYRDIHGEDSTFLSTQDIVHELIETLNEINPMMRREMGYYFLRLADRLNIRDTFEHELKKNDGEY